MPLDSSAVCACKNASSSCSAVLSTAGAAGTVLRRCSTGEAPSSGVSGALGALSPPSGASGASTGLR